MPSTTIAIVPRETFSHVRLSLESLLSTTDPPRRVIYIDGGSPRHVARYLEAQADAYDLMLVRTDHFLVPNEARNLALRYVDTEFVAFVDNDVVFSLGWLSKLESCAHETGAWLVQPLYCMGDPRNPIVHAADGICRIVVDESRRWFREEHPGADGPLENIVAERRKSDLVEFHTVLARMDELTALGPLDEHLMSTREHVDLSLMARSQGGSIWYEPAAQVTYFRPRWLRPTDLPFYVLRWSEEWNHASLAHFREKYQLSGDDPSSAANALWLTSHRLHGYRPYRSPFGRMLSRYHRVPHPVVDIVAQRLALRYHARKRATSSGPRLVHRASWASSHLGGIRDVRDAIPE